MKLGDESKFRNYRFVEVGQIRESNLKICDLERTKMKKLLKDIFTEKKASDNVAVIYNNSKYTYNQIYISVLNHKNKICGVPGKNVGLFIQNSIEYVVGYFVISIADRVIVPIETNCKGNQILSTIEYCELELIITNSDNFAYLIEILEGGAKFDVEVYNLSTGSKRCISKKFKRKQNFEATTCLENDVAIMLHTSGTTSNPKKVMLTHKNLLANIKSNVASLKLNSKDRCLIVLPMCFGYCNTSQFLTHFYLGGSIVIYDGFFVPTKFFHYIEKYRCTNVTCIPTMLYLLTKSKWRNYSLQSLRYLCFGGATISVDVLEKINELLPEVGIVQTYGQTEASPRITCLLPQDFERKIGSVGKPIPGVCVKIIDESGNELPANSKGEIVVKGDNVMKGYYKKAEETAETIQNGWLHTGDIGSFDDDGYLYIVGRIKNVIITGGLNIYPEEIEEILRSYPDVEEAIVLPRQHEILGEVPIAHVVVKNGSQVSTGQLLSYCKNQLEIQKIPSEIVVVDRIEKTYNGKVRRVSY